jgi:hypothetical protein
MAELETASDVIDALGGTTAVSKLTGASLSTVSNWRTFGKFPANTFVTLKAALTIQDATAPDRLWSMKRPVKAGAS